jgi:hypothetical protein
MDIEKKNEKVYSMNYWAVRKRAQLSDKPENYEKCKERNKLYWNDKYKNDEEFRIKMKERSRMCYLKNKQLKLLSKV